MKTFTVIGIYADNHQRHATTVEADDATEAQETYAEQMGAHAMLIAGVIEGDVKLADTEQDNAEWPMLSDRPQVA